MTVANVIVQHVPFSFPVNRLVAAQWINRDGKIHYVDKNGNDFLLL